MVQERKKEAKRPEGELNEFKEAEKNGATYKHNNVREIRKKRTSQRKKRGSNNQTDEKPETENGNMTGKRGERRQVYYLRKVNNPKWKRHALVQVGSEKETTAVAILTYRRASAGHQILFEDIQSADLNSANN